MAEELHDGALKDFFCRLQVSHLVKFNYRVAFFQFTSFFVSQSVVVQCSKLLRVFTSKIHLKWAVQRCGVASVDLRLFFVLSYRRHS